MSGNPQRQKGDRFERAVVNDCQAAGVPAQRVPLSGAAGGMFGGDIQVDIRPGRKKLECKVRQDKWVAEYGWLEGNYALVVKRDRSEPLVVMRLVDWLSLAREEW